MKAQYYKYNPRGFANEYTIYKCTKPEHLEYVQKLEPWYKVQAITAAEANKLIRWKGDELTEAHNDAVITDYDWRTRAGL